jgi:hypothetical protein
LYLASLPDSAEEKMDEISDLLFYFKNRNKGPYVLRLLEKYDQWVVRKTAFYLLGWLRRRDVGTQEPLALEKSIGLLQPVFQVAAGGDLPQVLEAHGSKIDFRPGVSEEDRRKIIDFVANNHRPEERLLDG